MIILCAVLSSIKDWVGMDEFAEEKKVWLREFLGLPNDIPSHDTLSDLLRPIDPTAFQEAFGVGFKRRCRACRESPICLDGKTLRQPSGRTDRALVERVCRPIPLSVDATGFWRENQRDNRHSRPVVDEGYDRCTGID